MKKSLIFLLLGLIIAGVFLVLRSVFPKSTGVIPFFIALIFLDWYLWRGIRERIFSIKSRVRYLLTIIYWFPLILIGAGFLAGLFLPFIFWNIPMRTYLLGLILIGYGSKIFPVVFTLLADLLRVFRFGISSIQHGADVHFKCITRSRIITGTGWIIGSAFLILLTIGMVWGNSAFQVRRVNIDLPELPARFDGLKIVHISDVHLGSWTSTDELSRVVRMINSLEPDLIFITGDLLNYCSLDIAGFGQVLAQLHAREGIFSILGNHDYGEYIRWKYPELKKVDHKKLIEFQKSIGWKLLLNENYILTRDTDSIAILGVENWGNLSRFQRLADVGQAQKGIEHLQVQLLMSHDPSHWDRVVSKANKNIDVTFSGHTHAFQFGIEWLGIKWSPSAFTYKEWGGLYSRPVPADHPQYLYVNRGLGSVGFPGRVGEWPEITLITLHRPK